MTRSSNSITCSTSVCLGSLTGIWSKIALAFFEDQYALNWAFPIIASRYGDVYKAMANRASFSQQKKPNNDSFVGQIKTITPHGDTTGGTVATLSFPANNTVKYNDDTTFAIKPANQQFVSTDNSTSYIKAINLTESDQVSAHTMLPMLKH